MAQMLSTSISTFVGLLYPIFVKMLSVEHPCSTLFLFFSNKLLFSWITLADRLGMIDHNE